MTDTNDGGKVIPFPVKFAGDDGMGDPAPEMRDAKNIFGDNRCRHRKTTFDKKARIVTCDHCGVNVDPFEVLSDVVDWIQRHRWEWEALQQRERESRIADAAHLMRVKRGSRGALLLGNCHVTGYHIGGGGIPTDAIAEGDYVSRNRLYRVRRESEAWGVVFWDPAHGMKELANVRRKSIPDVRRAVAKHWLWLNNNSKAAGLA
jgi:hypothetical protein